MTDGIEMVIEVGVMTIESTTATMTGTAQGTMRGIGTPGDGRVHGRERDHGPLHLGEEVGMMGTMPGSVRRVDHRTLTTETNGGGSSRLVSGRWALFYCNWIVARIESTRVPVCFWTPLGALVLRKVRFAIGWGCCARALTS